jgi:hypothetical protein
MTYVALRQLPRSKSRCLIEQPKNPLSSFSIFLSLFLFSFPSRYEIICGIKARGYEFES